MNTTANPRLTLKRFISIIPEYACIAVMVVVIIVASILAPKFFSSNNLLNIMKQSSVMSILAIGMGFVLISGCIDLSVGVNMAICALVSMVSQKYLGTLGGMGLAILVGVSISMLNYLVIYLTKARAVEIMMITFGLKMAYRGLAQAITGNQTFREKTSDLFKVFGKGSSLLDIPNIVVIMIVVAIIAWIILGRMRFGRQVTAVGINPEASRLAGISVVKTRLKCFIISGVCCAVAGILLASRTGAVKALSGDNYELYAICGLIIGGYSINGGYGNAWRVVVGMFVYNAINNVLNLLGVSSDGQQLSQGIIIILAVWIDVYLRNKRMEGKT